LPKGRHLEVYGVDAIIDQISRKYKVTPWTRDAISTGQPATTGPVDDAPRRHLRVDPDVPPAENRLTVRPEELWIHLSASSRSLIRS